MCMYCEDRKEIKVIPTSYLKSKGTYDRLDVFIHNSEEDEIAGLMIGNYEGYRYIDIFYCPMCGKRLGDE